MGWEARELKFWDGTVTLAVDCKNYCSIFVFSAAMKFSIAVSAFDTVG